MNTPLTVGGCWAGALLTVGVAGVGSPHGLLTERLHFHKDAGHCRFDALSLGGRTVSTPGWQFASLSWFVLTSARSNH